MAHRRPRRRFTREYKAQSVQRLIESGRPLADIAAELDVSPGQLSQWRHEQLAAGSAEALAARKAEQAETQRLRREVKRLEEEVEILRKAAAFFARGIACLIPSLNDRNLPGRRGPGGSKAEDAAFASDGFSSSGYGIRYFVTIVDYSSLTKAASHLRITQPALSLQLSNLEAECRAQLLIRTPKGVEPTEIGKILYRHGRIMLRQLEEARQEMQSGVMTVTGLVALGLPTTVTVPLGMPLVRAVREQYPGIRFQLFESLSGYLSELLANNRLDCAVLFRDVETRSISVLPLVRENLHLIGDCGLSDAVKERDTCSLSELHGVPLVLPSSAHDLRLTV